MPCAAHLPPVDLSTVTATSVLSGEHRVILQMLDVLTALAARAGREGRIPTSDARQALEVLTRFADHCHHGKEEGVLFPVLEAVQPGFGPLPVMLGEHVEGRALLAGMATAVASGDQARFASAATAYVALLRQHIDKEDGILFRFAARMLTPEQDAAILEGYRRLEHDDLGDGTHERLLGIANALATSYGIPRASDEPRIMRLLTAICGCKQDQPAPAAPPAWRDHLVGLRFLAAKVSAVHGPGHQAVVQLAESVDALIDAPAADHGTQAIIAQRIATLTEDFRPWAGACGSVDRLYTGLAEVVAAISAVDVRDGAA